MTTNVRLRDVRRLGIWGAVYIAGLVVAATLTGINLAEMVVARSLAEGAVAVIAAALTLAHAKWLGDELREVADER